MARGGNDKNRILDIRYDGQYVCFGLHQLHRSRIAAPGCLWLTGTVTHVNANPYGPYPYNGIILRVQHLQRVQYTLTCAIFKTKQKSPASYFLAGESGPCTVLHSKLPDLQSITWSG